jgi:hypothetical protein
MQYLTPQVLFLISSNPPSYTLIIRSETSMFAPSRLLILGAMGRTFLQGSAFVQPAMKPAGLGLIRTFAVGSPTSLSVEEVGSYFTSGRTACIWRACV